MISCPERYSSPGFYSEDYDDDDADDDDHYCIQVTLWELFTLGQEPYGDSQTPGHIIQVKLALLAMMMMIDDDDNDDDVDDLPI